MPSGQRVVTGVQRPRVSWVRSEDGGRGPGSQYPSILLLSAPRLLTPNMNLSLFVLPQRWGGPGDERRQSGKTEDIVQNNIPREWGCCILSKRWNFAVIFSINSELVMLCEQGESVHYNLVKFLLINWNFMQTHLHSLFTDDLCTVSFGTAPEFYNIETFNVPNQ